MKSLALVALGVLLGVAVMLAVPHGPPRVVFAGPPAGNGDVNGSGKIDLADAIYLLGYLFANGPEPAAIACDSCCTQQTGGAVPATGQTRCYGYVVEQGLAEVPCDSTEYPGQDGFYQTGCPMAGRFTDNRDGTVTDDCTGLMWQKETADVNGDGQISPDWDGGDIVLWQQALQYCEDLELAGRDDWRLPNVRELQSIMDYGRYSPAIDPVFGAESGRYWSSSTFAFYPALAWCVDFCYGIVASTDVRCNPNDVCNLRYVRAVRG